MYEVLWYLENHNNKHIICLQGWEWWQVEYHCRSHPRSGAFSVSSCLASSHFSHPPFRDVLDHAGQYLHVAQFIILGIEISGTVTVISPGWFIDNTRQMLMVVLPGKSQDSPLTTYKSSVKVKICKIWV